MRTKARYNYTVSIPANMPPAVVIAALHSFIPFIYLHPSITAFTEQPVQPSQVNDDPFFGPLDDTFRSFQVSDVVTLAPRLSKTISYQVLFQAFADGMRSRGLASAGVAIRAEYTVRARPGATSPAGSDSTGSSATVVGEEYEVNEDLEVEVNSLIMPIIGDNTFNIHRKILNAVMEQATKNYFGIPLSIPWVNDGKGTWQRITS
ncbi:hypothetical protein BGZ63DRAFT_422381 [Mariannaea sp. PMI_226]|nr:hypothetical protein BGZ63DRAFT_422381 [Mariannaea sp. PMI_226]